VISGVAVKQGDTVEKDQVLYYLEDKESDELSQAEEELETLELSYMKGLFGSSVSPEIISKVASGNTDSFASYQAKVTDMQNRIQAAEDRVNQCQQTVDSLSLQSTVNTNNAGVNTIPYEKEVTQAQTDSESAQSADTKAQAEFNAEKQAKIAELNTQIKEKQNQIADLETLVNSAESVAGSVAGSGTGTSAASGGVDTYIERRDAALAVVKEKLKAIQTAVGGSAYSASIDNATTIEELQNIYAELQTQVTDTGSYQTLYADYNAAVAQYNITAQQAQEVSGALSGYGSNQSALASRQKELASLQAALEAVNAATYETGESVQNAKDRLNQATQNLTEIQQANSQSAAAYQNQIASADAALKSAQDVLALLKEEQTQLLSDINAELDLSKLSSDIAKKKEEIEKLQEASVGATINAPVAGTVTSLAYAAGETTQPENAAAVIQVDGKGYQLSISVSNEQAKKVKVGDEGSLQNSWYYEDAQAILTSIKTDPDSQGQKKILVFDVTGSNIQEGQSLSISVGQKSGSYDYVIPKSALKEDKDGNFVLIVESKSSPLGNRYIATRVDVEVLESDDTNVAVSGDVYAGEYVITTSTKPVEAGKQVRLNES
jgi:multidrug efflux pump subunit AcrA (membrane-fusion protein)